MTLRGRVAVRRGGRRGGSAAPAPAVPSPAPAPSPSLGPAVPYSACHAPSIQVFFQPDGDVRACCHNFNHSLGNVAHQRLRDIWDGEAAEALRAALAVDDYSLGCQGCEAQVAIEGRATSIPARFDPFATHLTADPASRAWPRLAEFNLSNACNLQCIQCNGDLSSAIRVKREGRAPLAKRYDDAFFDDLAEFLPHLARAQFAGGEPFLAAENYRVWELLADVAPGCEVIVVTNATQWNRRIEDILERVPMSFCFSVDGITKETYESIRVDADFDEMMANLERYRAYAARAGTSVAMNLCLMVQNHHEFGDYLLWAEERSIPVNVSVVRQPGHCSIARLPVAELEAVLAGLEAQDAVVRPQLDLNVDIWTRELDRIREWARHGADADDPTSEFGAAAYNVMSFRRAGAGPHDDRDARVELLPFAEDGVIHEITVGPDDRVISCSPSLVDLIGDTALALVGGSVQAFQGASSDTFGTMLSYDVLAQDDDRIDAKVVFRRAEFRLTTLAMRNADGWADEAKILIATRRADRPAAPDNGAGSGAP